MGSTLQDLLKSTAAKDLTAKSQLSSSSTKDTHVVPSTTNPSQVVPPSTNQSRIAPVSPVKNFTKVPNSLAVEAIPQGMFKGLSKHTYDVLYKLTRGAIIPARHIQLTQLELMKLTGLSENTLRSHIKYLSVKGFLKISYQIGKHEGATYEVFIPEEMDSSTNPPQVVPSTPNYYQGDVSSTNVSQNLVLDTSQKLVGVGTTQTPVNIEQNEISNTLIKTNTKNDDDARVIETFLDMAKRLDAAVKKITGKASSKNEAAKWGTLAELLILELEVAASRAESVSSVPAFLTEVLRRQFFNARQQQSSSPKPSKTKIDTVGKSETGSYEIKPLDEKGKKAALEQLREFAADELLNDFQKWYTPEDWKWLIKELKK
jgi:hypothetical protein